MIFQLLLIKHPDWQKSWVFRCSVYHVHSYPIPVFSYPCVFRTMQAKWALTELLQLQVGVEENFVWFVLLLLRSVPPQLSCSNDGRVHHSRDPLSKLYFVTSDLLPRRRQPRHYITIINWADDLKDYTGPQERSHSFVSAYVMHRLILHATLSSCSPIRLWVSSKLMVKLEFLNGCGVHIGAAINSIYLLSG